MKPVFIRFGGLSLVRQKGYDPYAKNYHSPPTRRGLFAFPQKAIETFLLTGNYGNRTYQQKLRFNRSFTHEGTIWHHLGEHCPAREVLARKGCWVKTTVTCWQKAFNKESLGNRYTSLNEVHPIRSINEPWYAGVAGCVAKDHYEVFFDEKVG